MRRTSFMNKIKSILATGAVAALCMACTHNGTSAESNIPMKFGNGIYYWKTTFELSPNEKEFLKKHDIKRLYLKLFDVDLGEDFDGTEGPIPIATTLFKDSVPKDLEIVPVVYITQKAIYNNPHIDSLLYERIRAMGKKNGFDKMKEIQLDCDWTTTSRPFFFGLCKRMRQWAHHDSIQLSATIRLHQLRDSIPPVDRGVLMMYNTGSLYNKNTQNSILDERDFKPYLKDRIQYKLPLSVAYPTFCWSIVYREGDFCGIIHDTDFSDTTSFEKINDQVYRVKTWTDLDKTSLYTDDSIRIEHSDMEQVLKAKALLKKNLHPVPQDVILYHLDEKQLSNYTDQDIENILK